MSFAAAPVVSDLTLGNFLKVVSKGVVYNNLSEDSPIWDKILKLEKGPAEGREQRFLVRSAYGADAVGFVPPTGGDYPSAHQSTVNEGTARYKDYALTVEVERTLIAKAMSDFSAYGQPLAEELRAKSIAMSRMLSAAVYGDGTGVLATALGTGSIASGVMTLSIDPASTARGFIGWLEVGDKVLVKSTAGAAHTPTGGSGTFSHWLVNSKDREAGSVVMTSYNTAGAIMANTATVVTSGDYIYKLNQTTFNDLTAISTNDYNTISEYFPGLDSLTQDDGRKVNGLTLTGALAGTRRDVAGSPIDSSDFQKLMSQLMIAVGSGRYKYEQAMMAWETLDALIESRETDRRFVEVKDNLRGVEALGYIHGRNKIMFEADEFCPKQRIYLVPTGDVLQFHGSNFDFVQAQPGQKFHLKPSANGGHSRAIRAYMEGNGALLSVHGSAIGVIENFTI
jgi:hypothetical protein